MKVLDLTNNVVGSFNTAWQPPPAGTSTATLTAVLGDNQAKDPTNSLQLDIEADFGTGFSWVASGPVWNGNAAGTPPSSVPFQFSKLAPPKRVRGVLHTITQVIVKEVDLAFT
jgi:hypothetical protein